MPGIPDLTINPCTTRLVLVPIKAQVPPRIVRNESGISSREGATPRLRHQSMTTGISSATSGVLLRKAAFPRHTPARQSSAVNSVSTRLSSRCPR